MDYFTIRLPRPACLAVLSITYRDSLGNTVTLDPSTYTVDSSCEPARLIPANGCFWPASNFYQAGGVRITYLAGSYTTLITELLQVSAAPQSTVTLTDAQAGGPVLLYQPVPAGSAPLTPQVAVPYTVQTPTALAVAPALAGTLLSASYYAAQVPPDVQAAILLLAAHWYRNRETASDTMLKSIPFGIESLPQPEICYAGAFEL